MAEGRKITVEIPKKSYDVIRKREETSEHKTSRVLIRYLSTFFTILDAGEYSLFRMLSRAEARRVATTLDAAHRAERVSWEEFCTFSGERLAAMVSLYAPNDCVIISKLSAMGALEILALMEYARTIVEPERFERRTERFRA